MAMGVIWLGLGLGSSPFPLQAGLLHRHSSHPDSIPPMGHTVWVSVNFYVEQQYHLV